jgi:hypothetical protein
MSMMQRPTAAPSTAPRSRRLWFYAAASVLGVALLAVGHPSAQPPSSAPAGPAAPQPMGGAAPAGGAAAASPLEEPLRLIGLAEQTYRTVRDYSCTLVKRENIGGRMQPDNVIDMRVRVEPFSVYLRWQAPRNLLGQEVCYVAGQNGGKMRVHSSGALGAFGFVSLDPTDPKVRQNSRHLITEAGIGNLIKRYKSAWQTELNLNQTQVRIAEYEYNNRRCTRVETSHPLTTQGQYLYSRSVVYFDNEHHLPVRAECYAWPRFANDPGELVEVYSFVNLQLNVGLPDGVFQH